MKIFHLKTGKNTQRGQGLIEYVILVALIALVSLAATRELGNKVKTKLKEIRDSIDSGVPVNGGTRS